MSTTHHELHHKLYTLIPVHVIAFPSLPPAPVPPPPGQAAVMTGVMLRAVFFSILAEMSSRPLALDSGAPVVVMGEKVYVRGGDTEDVEDRHHVFQYNTSRDTWSCHTLWQQNEFLQSMPTARFLILAATIQSVIIASEGYWSQGWQVCVTVLVWR